MTSAQTNSTTTTQMNLSSADIQKIMNSTSAIVKAVLLKADGTYVELNYDSTPKKNLCHQFLGGYSPTIIGEFEELETILVRALLPPSHNLPLNSHHLPWPFSHLNGTIHGDIFCYKLDANAENVDLFLKDFKEYISKPLDIEKQRKMQAIFAENMKSDEKEEEMDDEQLPMDDEYMRKMLVQKIRDGFMLKNGREPNEEEIEKVYHATLQAFQGKSHLSTVFEEDDDGDYNPSEDESQELKCTMEDIINTETSMDDEFDEAMADVLQLGIHDRQQILEKAHALFVAETGNEPSDMELANAFKIMNVDMDDDPISSSILPWSVNDIRKELEKEPKRKSKKVSYLQSVFADIASQSDSLPTSLLKAAQRVVLESMQTQANEKYLCKYNCLPTDDELRTEVIELASRMIGNLSSSYLNLVVDELNRSPSPKLECDGNGSGMDAVVDDDGKCVEDGGQVIYERKTVVKHVEILTTPVKNRLKSARMDIYFQKPETDKNMLNAKKQFAKMVKRRGADDENVKLEDFLKIDGELSVTELDVEYEELRVVKRKIVMCDVDDEKIGCLEIGNGVFGHGSGDLEAVFTDV